MVTGIVHIAYWCNASRYYIKHARHAKGKMHLHLFLKCHIWFLMRFDELFRFLRCPFSNIKSTVQRKVNVKMYIILIQIGSYTRFSVKCWSCLYFGGVSFTDHMFFPLGRTQYIKVHTDSGWGDALYESTIDSMSSPSTINLNPCSMYVV